MGLKCKFIQVAAKKIRVCYYKEPDNMDSFECVDVGDFLPPDFKYDTPDGNPPREIFEKLIRDEIGPYEYVCGGFRNYYQAEGETGYRQAQPGDMWFGDHGLGNFYWDNDNEPHLYVMLPNRHIWDVDSRASNCTLPNDRLHRCWIRHGTPPLVTVERRGNPIGGQGGTCKAGANSIQMGDYHGFLRNGELT